jgi:hypothetical protein
MDPTLEIGDAIAAHAFARDHAPQRGDLVIFRNRDRSAAARPFVALAQADLLIARLACSLPPHPPLESPAMTMPNGGGTHA